MFSDTEWYLEFIQLEYIKCMTARMIHFLLVLLAKKH